MILFSGPPGRVVSLQDPAAAGVMKPLVGVTGVEANPNILFAAQKSIITRLTVSQSSSYQFLHTLGGAIYIYVFGERVGELSLSGLSLAVDCTNGNDDGSHGVEKMMAWYKANRVSSQAAPVQVQIGRTVTVQAFVVNFQADVIDPKSLLVQWTMGMMMLPN